MKSDPTCLNCNSTPDYRVERHDININLRVLFTISCCKFTVNFIIQSCNFKTLQIRSFPTPLTVTIKFTSQNLGGTWPAAARVSPRWQKERPWERGWADSCLSVAQLVRKLHRNRRADSCLSVAQLVRELHRNRRAAGWSPTSAPIYSCIFFQPNDVWFTSLANTNWEIVIETDMLNNGTDEKKLADPRHGTLN
jgi:hypothetical protein